MQTSSFLFLGAVALTASLGTVAACSSDSTAPASPTTTSAGNTTATTSSSGTGGTSSTATGTGGTSTTGTGGTTATTGTGGSTTGTGGAGGAGGSAPACTGGQVELTVKNYFAWCDVTVNGGTPDATDQVQNVCVTPGSISLSATANAGFMLGATPWHDTAGDKGSGDPASSTTVTVGANGACVWVCCPGAAEPCPAADQCP